jgi:hypothetical protein
MSLRGGHPRSTDNTDLVAEVGQSSTPAALPTCTWAKQGIPIYFPWTNSDFCLPWACTQRKEDRGMVRDSTQQCSLARAGDIFTLPSYHPLWLHKMSVNYRDPLSLWFLSVATPATIFLEIKCMFHLLAQGIRIACWLVILPPVMHSFLVSLLSLIPR